MAVRATANFGLLRYDGGNPEFPALPDGITSAHFIDLSRVAGLRAGEVRQKRVLGSAPAGNDQRFSGWQANKTWVNPGIIDFGVITSPIQRTVSLYNTRSTAVDVTAVNFGTTGVSLISPGLPQTLEPVAGLTFTIEAGIDGPADFDEFVSFTTAVGVATFRVIGRRIFSLNVLPEAPLVERLQWKTDVLRSTDGTEKAYSLLQSPNSIIDYTVKFTDDLERIKFRNQFIGGESALVVGTQKWWDATPLLEDVATTDTFLRTEYPPLSSWVVDKPISLVSLDGQTVQSQTLESINFGPDPDVETVVVLARFDGSDNSTSATNLVDGTAFTFNDTSLIDTAQSKFGGSSLHCTTVPVGFAAGGVELPHNDNMNYTTDMTIDMWFRPSATDISGNNFLASRWHSSDPGARAWRLQTISSGASIRFTQREGGNTRNYDFAGAGLVADTWYYLRISMIDGTIRCGLDGVELGAGQAQVAQNNGGSIRLLIGDYYDSGFVQPFRGHIDDFRFTIGLGRDVEEAVPTVPHPTLEETYTQLNLSTEIGTAFSAGDYAMPVGLGYISAFPMISTHPVNLEEISYQVTINQDSDIGELPASIPTLNTIPILEFYNMVGNGGVAVTELQRTEELIDSKLSNRVAFSRYPFSDEIQSFQVKLTSREDIALWKKFVYYLKGSYQQIYVPTFTKDFPDVTTTASNVFNMTDTDYAVLFGTTNPADRRGALRFEYDDGTILYRTITQVVDNGATEQFTVDSAVNAGTPKISYMHRARIFGDTVTFIYERPQQAEVRFKYRTIQE